MKNDNNMFQVLVASTVQAEGATLATTLGSDNNLGVMDTDTNLTVDSTTADTAKNIKFYMSPANSSNIFASVGKTINVNKVNSITKKAYAAGVSAKVQFTLPAIGNDTSAVISEGEEIEIKLIISDGNLITVNYGNEVRKFFVLSALSTADLTGAAFATAINADAESVTNGGFLAATYTAGTNILEVTFANNDEFSTSTGQYGQDKNTLNGKTASGYASPTSITVDDNVTGTLTTAFSYAQGKGSYVQELERVAAGWNGATGKGAHRFSSTLPLYNSFVPEAAAATNYVLYVFNYDLDYAQNANKINNVETIIAVPTGSTAVTTLDAIVGALVISGKKIGF